MAKRRKTTTTEPADTAAGPTPEERAQLDAAAEAALAEQEAAEAAAAEAAPAVAAFEAEGGTQAFVTRLPGTSEADPEAILVVCNSCRSTAWTLGKASATAIALKCAKCGCRASVKGAVGPARVPAGLAALAVEHVVHPEPKAAPAPAAGGGGGDGDDGDGEGGAPSLGDQGFMTIRARLTRDQYEGTVRRAMEAVRVMNHRDEAFRVQQWMGTALEYICADFLSGVDPAVLEIVEAQEAAVAEAAAKYREQGEEIPAKRARAIRSQVRDSLADALGAAARRLDRAPHVTPDLEEAMAARREEADERTAEVADDARIPDDGALLRAVRSAVRDYAQEYLESNPNIGRRQRLEYIIGDPATLRDLIARWEAAGGFLLEIRGDERTRTGAGLRPRCWLWIADEFDGATLALDADYADELDSLPDPQLTVVELLPQGFAALEAADRWDAPSFASQREEMQ